MRTRLSSAGDLLYLYGIQDIFETGYTTIEDGMGFRLCIVKQIVDPHDWSPRVMEGADGGGQFEITHGDVAAK